jgi:hypothetical protein
LGKLTVFKKVGAGYKRTIDSEFSGEERVFLSQIFLSLTRRTLEVLSQESEPSQALYLA